MYLFFSLTLIIRLNDERTMIRRTKHRGEGSQSVSKANSEVFNLLEFCLVGSLTFNDLLPILRESAIFIDTIYSFKV